MSKLYRARSLLYRRQILQENIRWKALDEIYKIYMRLHRSDLNISATIRYCVLIDIILFRIYCIILNTHFQYLIFIFGSFIPKDAYVNLVDLVKRFLTST